ncbi:MAG: hypothetical protein EHM20_12485 [Alphaproteobacteria bacterium]|nr:MAG: hypothetical protein EHM20_12485 [Alphaproteobacteria bacterium]
MSRLQASKYQHSKLSVAFATFWLYLEIVTHKFPHWNTVYHYFRLWRLKGA